MEQERIVCIKGVTYDLGGEYGTGYTRKGEKFLFDKEDFDKIAGYSWCFEKRGYVVAFTSKFGHREIVQLHRLVMGKPPEGKQIDHKHSTKECPNRKADNRKQNLRFATAAENSRNRGRSISNKSGHTGVFSVQSGRYWLARVWKNGKAKSKAFPYDEYGYAEACLWQEETARELFGEFAYNYDTAPPHGAEPGC